MKIALLVGPSEPIYRSLEIAFSESGHEVCLVSTKKETAFNAIRTAIEGFKPDFCFCINNYPFDVANPSGPELENYIERMSLPVGSLHWDAPWVTGTYSMINRFIDGPYPKHLHYFVIDRSHEEFLKERGLRVSHLRSAVDRSYAEREVSSDLTAKFKMPLAFLGAPLRGVAAFTQGHESLLELYRDLVLSEIQFWIENYSRTQMPSVHESVRALRFQIEILLSSEPKNFYDIWMQVIRMARQKWSEEAVVILDRYRGRFEMVYSWFRTNLALNRFSKMELRVFGGEEWARVLPRVKGDTRRLSDDEVLALFSSARVLFCTTKFQFQTAVHERPLQILVRGGFPLTDFKSEVSEIFHPGEIETYLDLDEAEDKIQFYLKNDDERAVISAAGRKRVLSENTYHHRVPVIVEALQKSFGFK